MLTRTTSDISVLLQLQFFEKVFFKTQEPSFPSQSPDHLGLIVSTVQHVGHAMTYKVLTSDTNKIISRSKICTATSITDPKQRLVPSDGETSKPPALSKSKSHNLLPAIGASNANKTIVLTTLDKLIGRTFLP